MACGNHFGNQFGNKVGITFHVLRKSFRNHLRNHLGNKVEITFHPCLMEITLELFLKSFSNAVWSVLENDAQEI
jgi:hypothetical protein